MKKSSLFCFVICCFLVNSFCFGQNVSKNAEVVNKRTALRCINLAKNYYGEAKYKECLSQLDLAEQYDDSISDLWYFKAVTMDKLKAPKYQIIDCCEKALQKDNWVDYNYDNTRVLYADLLCDTLRFQECLDVLDSDQIVYSADSEYIRAKALYRLNRMETIYSAREKIDVARKVYPKDLRFASLFFTYENPDLTNETVAKIADAFILTILQTEKVDGELLLQAVPFAEPDNKIVLLKNFNATKKKNPLYAKLALQNSLMNQKDAFNYLNPFISKEVDYDFLVSFLELVKEPNVQTSVRDFLKTYNGTILQDTNNDNITDLVVEFSRGRPSKITFDENQDGKIDWTLNCDYGVPINGVQDESISFAWSRYPYIDKVTFNIENRTVETYMNKLQYSWIPCEISKDNQITRTILMDVFYPKVIKDNGKITLESVGHSTGKIVTNSVEDPSVTMEFSVIKDQLKSIIYKKDNVLIAKCIFKNGIPSMKLCDKNGDGVFEFTEVYEEDFNKTRTDYCLLEEKQISNLFFDSFNQNMFIKMIQIDTNADSKVDFTEEYFDNGSKITTWDSDFNGTWDVKYQKDVFENKDDTVSVNETSSFYYGKNNELVSVTVVDGICQFVECGSDVLTVTKDKEYDFYWLGNETNQDEKLNSQDLYDFFNACENRVNIYDSEIGLVYCVSIGGFNYALMIKNDYQVVDEE